MSEPSARPWWFDGRDVFHKKPGTNIDQVIIPLGQVLSDTFTADGAVNPADIRLAVDAVNEIDGLRAEFAAVRQQLRLKHDDVIAHYDRAQAAEAALRETRQALAWINRVLTTVEGDNVPRGEICKVQARTFARDALAAAGDADDTAELLTVWWWPVGHGIEPHDVPVPYEIVLPAAEALDFAAKLPDARPMEFVKVFCETERDVRWRWPADDTEGAAE